MHISVCIFPINHFIVMRFCIYACLLLLYTTILVYHFIPPCDLSKGMVCLSAYGGSFVHLSSSFFSFTIQLNWKFYCDIAFTSKINLVHSVTSIITMLLKLLRMIWGYSTNFLMSFTQSPCSYFWCLKDAHFTSHWYYVTYVSF